MPPLFDARPLHFDEYRTVQKPKRRYSVLIEAVIFDVYGTLLQIGERRRPFRNLLKQARSLGRQPRADDARTLMTQNVGLAGAANLFGTQLGNVELATLELDLYAELASVRPYDDALRALESLKRAGLKVAALSYRSLKALESSPPLASGIPALPRSR
ncbi:MAG: HAD family hydrolase [Pseudomonadales bacterium]